MDASIEWVPVADLLDRASQELDVGQMLHTSVFSLFEAMSAVEIGNQKMDPGARPKGDLTPLEQRPLQLELSQEQLLGVMDQLLCLEATWHNGGSLATTVYSSLYMMQPQRVVTNGLLSVFCRSLQAACAEVNHLIMQGCVCEGLVRLKQRGLQDLDAASKCFSKALDKLSVWKSSLNLGQDHELGRDENINSHLVPAVPPRVVPLYSSNQAVQFFESLLQQLVRVCGVTHVDSSRALKEFILDFTARPTCPISRSALHIQ
eukprot:gene3404-3677_t